MLFFTEFRAEVPHESPQSQTMGHVCRLIVYAPVFREKQTKGVVALAFSLSDLKEKLGLTEEYLAMNFNS